MHFTKPILTAALFAQAAFAAVIPVERDASNLNPISGLPAHGTRPHRHGHLHHSNNPISGLPAGGRKHPHKKGAHKGPRRGKNPISGLQTPGRRPGIVIRPIEPREAEAELAQPQAQGLNPISGLPVPDHDNRRPANGKHPRPANGKRPHNGQGNQNRPLRANGNRPHNGQGNQNRPRPVNGNRPHNGQGNHNRPAPTNGRHSPHNGMGNQNPPRPSHKPSGIVIRPLTSVTIGGRVTMVPIPTAPVFRNGENLPTPTPKAEHTLVTHVPQLQPSPTKTAHPRKTHAPARGGDGMIGNKPDRRDVEESEVPEVEDLVDEKAEQLAEFDEGVEEVSEDDNVFDEEDDETEEIQERDVEDTEEDDEEEDEDEDEIVEDEEDDEEETEIIYPRDLDSDEGPDADFLERHAADALYWQEYERSLEA